MKQTQKAAGTKTAGISPSAPKTAGIRTGGAKIAQSSAYREAVARARDRRDAKMQRVQQVVGYVVVGLSIVGAIVLCLLRQIPVPVAVGLLILVGIRVYALKSELRRQNEDTDTSCAAVPSPAKRAAKRA